MEEAVRILVVDDDKAVAGCFRAALELEGFLADVAHTAIDAMQMAGGCEYDMIILDYCLPDVDGDVFLRETALGRGTKVLLVTGHLTREMVSEMFKLGICGYLAKPVGTEDLIHNVMFHLKNRNRTAYST
jgi:DNA-binding response OmpR family regulator